MKTSNIDPVSGNEIPPGSTAKNVRDDIDAKLSEGEYVIPADAVKYYGVAYFEKLIGKAKDGLKDMEDNGRIGGQSPKEAVQELNEEGGIDLEFAGGGEVKCPDNFYWDKDSNSCMPKKAYDLDNTSYDASGYKSDYDPYAHYLGFSGQQGKPSSTKQDTKTSVTCPEGYVLDPKTNQCVPANSPSSPNINTSKPKVEPRIGDDRVGTTGNVGVESGKTGNGSSGSFENMFDNYDYSDPDGVFNQTINELSEVGANKGTVVDKIGKGVATLAGSAVGAPALGGVVYGAVNKAANLRGLAQANANANVLASQGFNKQADSLRSQVADKARELGLDGVPEGMWDGKNIANSLLEKLSITPDKTYDSSVGTSSTANTVNERVGEGDGSSINGGYNDAGYNNQGKTRAESGYSEEGGGYDDNGKSVGSSGSNSGVNSGGNSSSRQGIAGAEVGSEKDGSNKTGAFAKGGLVTKPKKKSYAKKGKSKVNSKKGLGRKTK